MKTILVLNTGSSSVKASLFCRHSPCVIETSNSTFNTHTRLITAHAERLGTQESSLHATISVNLIHDIFSTSCDVKKLKKGYFRNTARTISEEFLSLEGIKKIQIAEPKMTHEGAIQTVVELIRSHGESLFSSLAAVGHRVVHGGTLLSDAIVIDETVLQSIENVAHLAPLHNPANIQGIKISWMGEFKVLPNVAVFDTAFHSTIPRKAHTYPIPEEYRANDIRKYGFHGTSVKFVSQVAIGILKRHNIFPANVSYRLVVAHLGNGDSVTAVVDGKSVDTSMEFTPLSGVMMGSRSGTIDPSVITYAMKRLGKSPDEVIYDLNRRSGLKGISNGDNDMRAIESRALAGDKCAKLALDMFVYNLSKSIASMMVACGGNIDAIVFTAGIGENSAQVRKMTIDCIGGLLGPKVQLDDARNSLNGVGHDGIITKNLDGPAIMVVPTDEEVMICQECERLVEL